MSTLAYRHPNDPNAAFPEPRYIEQDERDFEIALHLERIPTAAPEEIAMGTAQENRILLQRVIETLRHRTPANLAAVGADFIDCVRTFMNEDAEAVIRKEERT